MPKYIAQPVEVDALQFDGTQESVQPFAATSYAFPGSGEPVKDSQGQPYVEVHTLGGHPYSRAFVGDWIVRHAFPDAYFEVYPADEFVRRFRAA